MSSKQGNLVGLHAIVSNFKAHLPFGGREIPLEVLSLSLSFSSDHNSLA